MSDIVTTHGVGALAFSDERRQLIKDHICRPTNRVATDDELAMFIGQCERTQLDPFARQIWAIFRFDKKLGREVMTIQVAIDGARLIAERTGKYQGQMPVEWCGGDGVWRDIWLKNETPFAARVGVLKAGTREPTYAVARYSEYKSDIGPFWKNKPALMIGKCAEMLALRKAFPAELSGLYAREEIADIAHGDSPSAAAIDPPPEPVEVASGSERQSLRDAFAASDVTAPELQMHITADYGVGGPDLQSAVKSLTSEQIAELIDWLATLTPAEEIAGEVVA